MADPKLPLAGLNIAVTRPQEQAQALAAEIGTLGGNCICFPLLEITPLADNSALLAVVKRLQDFQLAIFISPNAVRYAMQAIGSHAELPATLQIATVGLSSAQALHKLGVEQVLTPQQHFDSEGLLALPALQQVTGQQVLIFRGDSGRELLGDTLQQRGAQVHYASCYQRRKVHGDMKQLLASQAICVSSSEALQHLHELLTASGNTQLLHTPLFVSHPRIAAAAHKLGWHHIISSSGGDQGLLSALRTWATQP
jgi:uroporphyrinogen-III synthase